MVYSLNVQPVFGVPSHRDEIKRCYDEKLIDDNPSPTNEQLPITRDRSQRQFDDNKCRGLK